MYQSQVRPRSSDNVIVHYESDQLPSKTQFATHGTAPRIPFLQILSSSLTLVRSGAQVLITGCILILLSGCGGVVYRGGTTVIASSGTTASSMLSQVSCGTQYLTGAQTKACSVYLTANARGATVVTLKSSNAALHVPPSVSILAGSKSTGFNAVSSAVSRTVTVTISASSGGVTKTSVITLMPAGSSGSPSALSKLSCGTQSLTGAQTKGCSIYLSAATTSDTTVKLTSTNKALQVPAAAIVPAGQTAGGFTITASAVSTTQTATLTATANGSSQTDTITLYPTSTPVTVSALSRVSCAKQTLTGPMTTACTVYLTAAGTSSMVVKLSTNNGALQVPPSVTVAAGATNVGFTATAASVKTTQTATLTATANGVSQSDVIQLTGASTQPTTQHKVQLSWIAPTTSADAIVGYKVYRANGTTTAYSALNSTVDTQTTYTDATVQSGSTYQYVVKSVDKSGMESNPSNPTSVTIP